METAILSVAMILGFSVMGWIIRYEASQNRLREAQLHNSAAKHQQEHGAMLEECLILAAETRDVLREASRLKAAKSPFDEREKLPSVRYVPVARRRAMAERESLAPVTHNEKVRENNIRAMEG